MTVSLDTPRDSGNSEQRLRAKQALLRARGFMGKMARNPLTAIGGGIIALLLLVAIFAPLIAPYNPLVQDLNSALVAPNAQHWFGTDEFGRDIFSRGVWLAHHAVYRAAGVGHRRAARSAAWRHGGLLRWQGRHGTDARHRHFHFFSKLVLALAFVAALGPGLEHVVIAITLTAAADCASGSCGNALVASGRFYLCRSPAGGIGRTCAVASHRTAVPAVGDYSYHHEYGGDHSDRCGPWVSGVRGSATGSGMGAMISSGRTYMMECWWVVTIPGLAILINSTAFNFLGDGLRDILDPRSE